MHSLCILLYETRVTQATASHEASSWSDGLPTSPPTVVYPNKCECAFITPALCFVLLYALPSPLPVDRFLTGNPALGEYLLGICMGWISDLSRGVNCLPDNGSCRRIQQVPSYRASWHACGVVGWCCADVSTDTHSDILRLLLDAGANMA